MKRSALLVLTLITAALAIATLSQAEPYLSVNGGPIWLEDSDLSVAGYNSHGKHTYDMGYMMNVAIGNAYTDRIRAELEIPYRFDDIHTYRMVGLDPQQFDREISFLALMANIYYDFDTSFALEPFAGAGIGYGLMQIEGGSDHHDAGAFAYQLMAGCGYALSETVTIDLQYRIFATEDPEFTTHEPTVGKISINSEYMSQNIMLGLRFGY